MIKILLALANIIGIIISRRLSPNMSNLEPSLTMKRLFKKNKPENATNYKPARAFAIEDRTKENTMDELSFSTHWKESSGDF